MFLRKCLLPCILTTDVAWSQIILNNSESCVFLAVIASQVRLANLSGSCTMMVFIASTAQNIIKESEAVFCCHVGQRGMRSGFICVLKCELCDCETVRTLMKMMRT